MDTDEQQSRRRSRPLLILGSLVFLAIVAAFFIFQRAMASHDNETSLPAGQSAAPRERIPDSELQKRLTVEQYRVTKQCGTEPAFQNEYWDNHEPGIYVDIISGEPLFTSLDKFDSGSGWPSFTKPISKNTVEEKTDNSFGMRRTEVRTKDSDAHLGHVFDDGPGPTGMRYCINSAALRFVPVAKLKEQGYGQFLPLFEGKK